MGMFSTLFLRIGVYFDKFHLDIRYYEIFFYLSFLIATCLIIKKGLKRREYLLFFSLIFFLFINNLILYIVPYKGEILSWFQSWDRDYHANHLSFAKFSMTTIKIDINIIMFFIIVYAANISFCKDEIHLILTRFVKYGFSVYIFTAIELFFKVLISSELYYDILNFSFGIINGPIKTISRYGFNPIFGFCAEPQHFAKGLFVWMLAALVVIKGRNKWTAFVLYTITSIFTTSFAAILYISLILAIIILDSKKNIFSLVTCLVSIFSVAAIFFVNNSRVFSTYLLRIRNLFYLIFIPNNMEISSESTRIISIIETFKYFLNRPFWGIGIGTTYAHGAVTSLLSNIGLFGFTLWFLLTKNSINDLKLNKAQWAILFSYLIAMFFTTTYWMSFYSLEYILFNYKLKTVVYNYSKFKLIKKNDKLFIKSDLII